MGDYIVAHLSHNISKKQDKDPIIKIEFTIDDEEYSDLVADLTTLKSLQISINREDD